MSTAVVEAVQVIQPVFSVCVPGELLANVVTAVESVKGAQFVGEFQEYVTNGKKPQFPTTFVNAPMCVAVIDCDHNPEAAFETMKNLQQQMPGKIRLVAVSEDPEPAFLMRLIRIRCNEVLTKPIVPGDLASALLRFQSAGNPDADAPLQKGKAIALIGSKGGVGTSTLAVHLAMHLVKTHQKRVLLVDNKHQLGHLALYLGIKQPRYYFSELLQNADRLDAHLLEGLTTRHSTGLDVIASPHLCTPRYETRVDAAASVLGFLRQRYDFVLLDMEAECSEWLKAVIDCCHEVDIICTPDVASLRDFARHIEYLSLIEGFASKLRVILNRGGIEPAVPKADIERATRFPVNVEVPNNPVELMKAMNAGEPIPVTNKGKFTQAIAKWAKALVAESESEAVQTPSKKRLRLWG